MFVANNIRLLEIDFTAAPAVGNTAKFPLDQEIEGKKFKAIESFYVTQLNRSPNNVQVLSAAEAADVILFFYVGSQLRLYGIPYTMLNTAANSGIIRQLANMPIVISKSYAQVVSTNAIVANRAIVIAFHYD
jgi:predicted TIM-barrel fold metal-dependent hydrolase